MLLGQVMNFCHLSLPDALDLPLAQAWAFRSVALELHPMASVECTGDRYVQQEALRLAPEAYR